MIKDYIRHEMKDQKYYVRSYILALFIILATYAIEHNRNQHISDRTYWIGFLEPIFNVSFADRGMNIAVLATGYTIALFSFTISILIKKSRLEKHELQRQIGIQQARDDLLALASHQLRTPATGVKQYLGILLDDLAGDVSEQQKKILQKAYDNNERQLRIINDFLYMAKLDSGRIVIHPRKFNAIEVIDEVINSYAYRFEEKHITITAQYPHSLVIISDKQCLTMAFENLVSNAVKYTEKGGEIYITANLSRNSLRINVEDNGVGINRKDRKLLFSKFSRIENKLSAMEEGTGIGLYIAQTLIELNGGHITYKAKATGSLFTIRLPKATSR